MPVMPSPMLSLTDALKKIDSVVKYIPNTMTNIKRMAIHKSTFDLYVFAFILRIYKYHKKAKSL